MNNISLALIDTGSVSAYKWRKKMYFSSLKIIPLSCKLQYFFEKWWRLPRFIILKEGVQDKNFKKKRAHIFLPSLKWLHLNTPVYVDTYFFLEILLFTCKNEVLTLVLFRTIPVLISICRKILQLIVYNDMAHCNHPSFVQSNNFICHIPLQFSECSRTMGSHRSA